MRPRLLLDEDVHFDLARALRLRGFDVAHAQELHRKGRSDAEQLQYAVSEGRCLVTYNVRDFVLLHREYTASGRSHCGLLVSKQLPLRETLRRLLQILSTRNSDDLQNRIEFL